MPVVQAFSQLKGSARINSSSSISTTLKTGKNRIKRHSYRIYPGRGVIPLKESIAGLKEINYNGPVSLEMFRPEYWRRPAKEVTAEGISAVKGLVS